jgi:hypothetical protein
MTKVQDHELDWLAFRYLAGELSATELLDFESRLGADEAARSSLSDMVELTLALSAAGPAFQREPCATAPADTTARRPNRRIRARSIWLAGVLACSAVVLVAAWSVWPGPHHIAPRTAGTTNWNDESLKLAVIWNEARFGLVMDESWVSDEASDETDEALPASDLDLAASASREESDEWPAAEAPSWVWAGVIAADRDEPEVPTTNSGGI